MYKYNNLIWKHVDVLPLLLSIIITDYVKSMCPTQTPSSHYSSAPANYLSHESCRSHSFWQMSLSVAYEREVSDVEVQEHYRHRRHDKWQDLKITTHRRSNSRRWYRWSIQLIIKAKVTLTVITRSLECTLGASWPDPFHTRRLGRTQLNPERQERQERQGPQPSTILISTEREARDALVPKTLCEMIPDHT